MHSIPAFAPSLPLSSSLTRHALPTSCAPRSSSVPCTVKMAFSSINRILTPDPVSLPCSKPDAIAAIYKQVLGNAYLMDSEREELAKPESTFRLDGDVRAFVLAIALSDAYKSRFFEPVSQYRFIELAFKHLLGRAPASKQEYVDAMAVYHGQGFEACIRYFVESQEYTEKFGNFIVPYGIYLGCYPTSEQFNRSVAMRLTPSSSDKGRSTMLQYCVLTGDSPNWLNISRGLPPGTEKGTGFNYTKPQWNKNAPVKVGIKVPGGVVYY